MVTQLLQSLLARLQRAWQGAPPCSKSCTSSTGPGNTAMAQPTTLTIDQYHAIMPRAPAGYLPYLNQAMAEAQINTPLRMAAFLAQLAHESEELRVLDEEDSGKAYEGRKDLGNVQPGDGPRYKGRGPLQLTGRANYHAYGRALGLDLEGHPELADKPEVMFRIACLYWTWHHLNADADLGITAGFDAITKAINGGYTGKAQRDAYYAKARATLGVG